MRVTPEQSEMPPQEGQQEAEQPQGGEPAEQIIESLQQGFAALGQLIQQAGDKVDPADVQLYQTAAQATDALIQSLTGPSENQGRPQQEQSPGGPMSENDKVNGSAQAPQY